MNQYSGGGEKKIIAQSLVAAMCGGDQEAFDAIYLKSYNVLKGFLTNLLHSPEDAEEIVHDVFLHILNNRNRIDPTGNFKIYLYKVAKSKAFDLLNRRQKEKQYFRSREHAPSDLEHSPEELIMTEELATIINLYISKMPPQRRQAFDLRREGKSIKEIAEIMGLSQQTVKNYLQAAVKGLNDVIVMFLLLFVSQ